MTSRRQPIARRHLMALYLVAILAVTLILGWLGWRGIAGALVGIAWVVVDVVVFPAVRFRPPG